MNLQEGIDEDEDEEKEEESNAPFHIRSTSVPEPLSSPPPL
jgi:hypothetical protein